MACMHVREWPKTGPASRFTQCLLPVSFCRHVRCHLDVPRQSGGCHSETTCSMLPEAPVASREATSLPGHLTCLPGRAAWGVRSSAPHVQDALLVAVVAPSDLELASWSPLVRTVYYCAVGTRATFLPSERSSRDSSPESTHDFT